MIVKWIVASLFIAALVGLRVLLTRRGLLPERSGGCHGDQCAGADCMRRDNNAPD